VCLIVTAVSVSTAQLNHPVLKGKFYVYWGWNRAAFTNSDIHLSGSDYNITLKDVVATDRQSPFSFKKYFFPTDLSIPQTNFKMGYHLNEKWEASIGFDHMKYVMANDQTVKISGNIDRPYNTYRGEYNNDDIVLAKSFLRYEHTNGLNYVYAEANRRFALISTRTLPFKSQLAFVVGGGFGALRPRTDVHFLGQSGPNVFHIAGWGTHAKLGLHALMFKRFSILSEIKAGYIDMPNILATADAQDKASQHFSYIQANILVGATFGFK
jgi:hypothetical protein